MQAHVVRVRTKWEVASRQLKFCLFVEVDHFIFMWVPGIDVNTRQKLLMV